MTGDDALGWHAPRDIPSLVDCARWDCRLAAWHPRDRSRQCLRLDDDQQPVLDGETTLDQVTRQWPGHGLVLRRASHSPTGALVASALIASATTQQ